MNSSTSVSLLSLVASHIPSTMLSHVSKLFKNAEADRISAALLSYTFWRLFLAHDKGVARESLQTMLDLRAQYARAVRSMDALREECNHASSYAGACVQRLEDAEYWGHSDELSIEQCRTALIAADRKSLALATSLRYAQEEADHLAGCLKAVSNAVAEQLIADNCMDNVTRATAHTNVVSLEDAFELNREEQVLRDVASEVRFVFQTCGFHHCIVVLEGARSLTRRPGDY